MLKNHTVQDNIVGKCKHLTVIIFSNIISKRKEDKNQWLNQGFLKKNELWIWAEDVM